MPALNSQQIADAKEAFSLYGRDGKITADDFGTVLRACGRNPTNQQVAKLLEEVDENNSGFVELNAFLKAFEQCESKADNADEVKEAFRVFDKEANGFIPVSEIRHVLTTLGEKLTTEEVDQVIKEAEVDADGNINYAEFVAMLMKK